MANPLNLLGKLRRYERGSDIGEYLHTEYRQNLKAVEDAFRKLSPNSKQVWLDAKEINITGKATNPTKGNVKYDKMRYWINGPQAIIRVDYSQLAGSGTSGSGDYFINIPSAIGKIDTSVIPAYTGSNAMIGQCQANIGFINITNGTTVLLGSCIIQDESRIRISGFPGNFTSVFWGDSNIGFNGNLYFSGEFKIPLKQS